MTDQNETKLRCIADLLKEMCSKLMRERDVSVLRFGNFTDWFTPDYDCILNQLQTHGTIVIETANPKIVGAFTKAGFDELVRDSTSSSASGTSGNLGDQTPKHSFFTISPASDHEYARFLHAMQRLLHRKLSIVKGENPTIPGRSY
jgi:hypothetical protein